jgi:TPP-dependent trihydroxycyclohexane-1,2-dione (THcHDO) dehydratase
MFNIIPFKRQYSGERTRPSEEELTQIVEAIKVEHENLIVDEGGLAKPIKAETFGDVCGHDRVAYGAHISYESSSGYFHSLEISKTEEGKFYVTVTDGDDDSTFMMMDEIKDFEDIEL